MCSISEKQASIEVTKFFYKCLSEHGAFSVLDCLRSHYDIEFEALKDYDPSNTI